MNFNKIVSFYGQYQTIPISVGSLTITNIPKCYTFIFYFPYLSLLAQPVNILVYWPVNIIHLLHLNEINMRFHGAEYNNIERGEVHLISFKCSNCFIIYGSNFEILWKLWNFWKFYHFEFFFKSYEICESFEILWKFWIFKKKMIFLKKLKF